MLEKTRNNYSLRRLLKDLYICVKCNVPCLLPYFTHAAVFRYCVCCLKVSLFWHVCICEYPALTLKPAPVLLGRTISLAVVCSTGLCNATGDSYMIISGGY